MSCRVSCFISALLFTEHFADFYEALISAVLSLVFIIVKQFMFVSPAYFYFLQSDVSMQRKQVSEQCSKLCAHRRKSSSPALSTLSVV